MSNKSLIIKQNGITRTYKFKDTHTGYPYICENKTNHLDFTTNSTTGLRMNLIINGKTYRPIQTVTTSGSTSTSNIISITSGRSTYITTLTSGRSVMSVSTLYSGKTSSVRTTARGNMRTTTYTTKYTYTGTIYATVRGYDSAANGHSYAWGPDYRNMGTTSSTTYTNYSFTGTGSASYPTGYPGDGGGRYTGRETWTRRYSIVNFSRSRSSSRAYSYTTTDYSPFYSNFTSTLSGTSLKSGYTTSGNVVGIYDRTHLTRSTTSYTSSRTSNSNILSTTQTTKTSSSYRTSTAVGNLKSTTRTTITSSSSSSSSTVTEI